MTEPVAVLTPYPALRRGLAEILTEALFSPEEPEDPIAWMSVDGHRAILMAVAHARDVAQVVDLRKADQDVVVVALLPEVSPSAVREAILAGACSVASWDTPCEELVAMLRAGLESRSLLPTQMLQQLASDPIRDSTVDGLEREQFDWLRCLARGMTVSELAVSISYSEREVYRLLRSLYEQLGVRTRTEAMIWAAQQGIVD